MTLVIQNNKWAHNKAAASYQGNPKTAVVTTRIRKPYRKRSSKSSTTTTTTTTTTVADAAVTKFRNIYRQQSSSTTTTRLDYEMDKIFHAEDLWLKKHNVFDRGPLAPALALAPASAPAPAPPAGGWGFFCEIKTGKRRREDWTMVKVFHEYHCWKQNMIKRSPPALASAPAPAKAPAPARKPARTPARARARARTPFPVPASDRIYYQDYQEYLRLKGNKVKRSLPAPAPAPEVIDLTSDE